MIKNYEVNLILCSSFEFFYLKLEHNCQGNKETRKKFDCHSNSHFLTIFSLNLSDVTKSMHSH